LVFNWQVFVSIRFSPLATYRKFRILSADLGGYMQHAILRHGARLFFFLAYGEDSGEGLDQTAGTKVGRRTVL
jgi:hypothetical protein